MQMVETRSSICQLISGDRTEWSITRRPSASYRDTLETDPFFKIKGQVWSADRQERMCWREVQWRTRLSIAVVVVVVAIRIYAIVATVSCRVSYLWKEAYWGKAVCVSACVRIFPNASVCASEAVGRSGMAGQQTCGSSPTPCIRLSPGPPSVLFAFMPLLLFFAVTSPPPTTRWRFGRSDIKMRWMQLHKGRW